MSQDKDKEKEWVDNFGDHVSCSECGTGCQMLYLEEDKRTQMLARIRASLAARAEGRNEGGDVEVMASVDRIVATALKEYADMRDLQDEADAWERDPCNDGA